MGIESWSTTPGSNTSAPPDGAPEGMAPSAVNDTMRQQMADHRTQWNDAQWFQYGDGDGAGTITYVAANQFKVEGADVTAHYHAGRRVKVTGATTGTVYGTITAVSFSTDTTVTVQLDSGTLQNEALTVWTSILRADQNAVPASSWSFRNLLINGDMRIDQRGGATSVTNGYTVDRWHAQVEGAAIIDASRDTSVVPAGSGFSSSLKIDVQTADTSLASSDRVHVRQPIEAQNLQHLLYGSSAAKTLAVSFWVRSPKAGVHCVGLYVPDQLRTYIREYTVASADTWQFVATTFPGYTGGVINDDNGEGLHLLFALAAGSNHQGSAGSWIDSSTHYQVATSNQVNVVDNASNNFYLTGVQLEVGPGPTPFESKPVATELAACRRYFWRAANGDQQSLPNIVQNGASGGYPTFQFPVEMRTNPGLSHSALAHFQLDLVGSSATPTAMSATYTSPQSSWVTVEWSAAGSDGDAVRFYTVSTSATLDWDCEL